LYEGGFLTVPSCIDNALVIDVRPDCVPRAEIDISHRGRMYTLIVVLNTKGIYLSEANEEQAQ
jgi:hypothetical protein